MRVTPIQSQAYNFKSQEINPTQENISIPEEVPAEIEATTLPEPLPAAENKTASTANVLLGLGLLASLGVAGAALYKNKNIKKEITSLKDKLSNSEKTTEELKTKLKEAEAKAAKTNEIKSDKLRRRNKKEETIEQTREQTPQPVQEQESQQERKSQPAPEEQPQQVQQPEPQQEEVVQPEKAQEVETPSYDDGLYHLKKGEIIQDFPSKPKTEDSGLNDMMNDYNAQAGKQAMQAGNTQTK